MKRLALIVALGGALALGTPAGPATASVETAEAKAEASDAAATALADMLDAFGERQLQPGQYLWRDIPARGEPRLVISLSDQLAFLYRGDTLVAVATISTGTDQRPTPTGIFSVLDKRPFYRSKKYDNAPMPFMQRIDGYGVALHGGFNPGYPASHGCIRLPGAFAKKLYAVTEIGTPVLVGA